MGKFKKHDKVRVKMGRYEGTEAVVEQTMGMPSLVTIKVTKPSAALTASDPNQYREGETDEFGEEYLELIVDREEGKPVKVEHVTLGDKIEVTYWDRGVTLIRQGEVGGVWSFSSGRKSGKRSSLDAVGGGQLWDDSIEEYSITLIKKAPEQHVLESAPIGARFSIRKAWTGDFIFIKHEAGWWIRELRTDNGVLDSGSLVAERNAIVEYDAVKPELKLP